MAPVKLGLLGLGTVGGGVATTLSRNAAEIARRAGQALTICHAAAKEYDADAIEGLDQIGKITDDAFAVVDDPEVEIVIELIGGYSPAKELALRAIANKKHLVTANKALIAAHGNEIFAAAREAGVAVAYEAAVAGGVPVIKALREGLAANRIQWAAGIINGTGNYILTEMRDKGRDFAAVLQEAQRLGYAEADPTFDVEGIDAAHKLTIMGSIAFGIPLQFDKTYVEGIGAVRQQDVADADELGYRIKHLGIARRVEAGVELRVHPTLIPAKRLLANVEGVMNAVLVQGNAVGPTLYYGAGAGALPTASSVLADVIDVARARFAAPENRVPQLGFQPNAMSDLRVLDMEDVQTAYYLRLEADDRPGALSEVTAILGAAGISIEAIRQKEPAAGARRVPVIILTQRVVEREMNRAIKQIEALDAIAGEVRRIRVESLD